MTSISLRELEGEIKWVSWGEHRAETVQFLCPVCREHYHLVPFVRGEPTHGKRPGIGNMWGHTGGNDVDDITLAPSYLATSGRCRLHVFIRGGVVQVLGDSGPPK